MINETNRQEFLDLRKKTLEKEYGGLNPMQRSAVFRVEGPVLVLAGAGSGKTSVLTNRIAYMIKYGNAYHGDYIPGFITEKKASLLSQYLNDSSFDANSEYYNENISPLLVERKKYPYSILAITFTNKAAREMKERIERLVGDVAQFMWIGTFHATCIRILRSHIDKIGYNRNFVIFDTSDQQTVVKDCLKTLNLNEKNFPVRDVLGKISSAKDDLISPEDLAKAYDNDYRMHKIAELYRLYQEKLKSNNALDFDDIIMLTVKLFEKHPDALEEYHRKFKYILVDEYQDTNNAQYKLISLLAKGNGNLCVVGDDDQSIYGWRGANINNILNFENEYPDCQVIKLEQNYRSTQTILDAANEVIKNNTGRKAKRLWTQNPGGSGIQLNEGSNEREEAYFIAREIKKLVRTEGRSYKDFAVLYRINAQSRVIEDVLMKEGIPYKIFGGLRFYDRKEIKDLIAYLRLIQNTDDDVALRRIINVPKRGIGNVTVGLIEMIANDKNCSMFDVVAEVSEIPELARAESKLSDFHKLIMQLRAEAQENPSVKDILESVIEKSGIKEELEAEKTIEAETRLENIKELLSGAMEFEEQSAELQARLQEDEALQEELLDMAQGQSKLEEYLASIMLVSDIDNMDEENDNIVLMTLHSAKGLEFPVVFMVGMEDGVFPGMRAITSINMEDLEEERRLCYVGITRAREKLFLSFANQRTLFGRSSYNRPSMFLEEIPKNLIISQPNRVNSKYGKESDKKKSLNLAGFGSPVIANKSPAAESVTAKKKAFDFKAGDNVVHKKFGVGRITSIEEVNGDFKLEIEFKKHGMKRLMAAFANLVKL
jgi:DNA helicase-2/ATP-dependent DNA helicase PcrA